MDDGLNMGFTIPWGRWPWWVGLVIAALAGMGLALRALERRREGRLGRFVEGPLAPRLLPGHDAALRKPLFWLAMLGFAFMAAALSQPHWGKTWQEVERLSHDVVVVLDVSESMRAENPLPNRLERAKQKIMALLERASGDRFGLVVFSGAAAAVCPLTLDHGYFLSVLHAVDTDSISLEGTNIAAALDKSVELLEEGGEGTGGLSKETRAIVLISDGEQVSGDAVASARKAAAHARVFVVGVGSPRGAEVTYADALGQRMSGVADPGPHLSKLDEKALERIAREGGGGYVRSGPDHADVDAVYAFLERLSARHRSSDLRLILANRYQWPLALAMLCFAAEGLWLVLLPHLRDRHFREGHFRGRGVARGGAALVLVGMLLCGPAQADSIGTRLEEGYALLRTGDAAGALDAFYDLRTDAPRNDAVLYAMGCAHYGQGLEAAQAGPLVETLDRLVKAREVFERLRSSTDDFVRRHAGFNAATCAAQFAEEAAAAGLKEEALQAFEASIRAYEDVLALQPRHEAAARNLDHVRYLMKRMLQYPPSEQERTRPGGEEDEKRRDGGGGDEDEEGAGQRPRDDEEAPESGGASDPEAPEEGEASAVDSPPSSSEAGESMGLSRHAIEALLQSLEEQDRREQMKLRRAARPPTVRGGQWW